MHLSHVSLHPEKYPTTDQFPFILPVFQNKMTLPLDQPVTIFVGENGTGKSTLLEAMAHRCGIHLWGGRESARVDVNPYETRFYQYISIQWSNGPVPGSFFGASSFASFRRVLERWAVADPGQLDYFGGRSLLSQSHGQSIMSFFTSRYNVPGLYFMDEPETALSPASQMALRDLLNRVSAKGHAQFVMATHSPILLSCNNSRIYSFDHVPLRTVAFQETTHFKTYKSFFDATKPALGKASP
jgi:predicted ATPase